ncbi:unnamed protein product [Clonostachys byssicola]|uniref:Uncharacterized protein n=1 Tax=Clonostachys byssicola TaxID=160290 RepID=A0A9N9UQC0_9HYPO|nr:unnamed protein product [Clonostachys byssicola]
MNRRGALLETHTGDGTTRPPQIVGSTATLPQAINRHSRRYDSPPLKQSPRRSSEHKDQHRAKSVPHKDDRLGQAAKAALDAAAIEAIRVRHHPGPWAGTKGARVATAAVGAAIIDRGMMGRDPEERSTRHMLQSAIGGLAATRLLNGARKK